MITEQKWREIIEKGCEYERHPQQDICFCNLNVGYICWWKNCPKINKLKKEVRNDNRN